MVAVNHVYIYAWPYMAGSQPLLANEVAERSVNLYRIAAGNNNAGLVPGNHYGLTISPASNHNPPSDVVCQVVAPPEYAFIF